MNNIPKCRLGSIGRVLNVPLLQDVLCKRKISFMQVSSKLFLFILSFLGFGVGGMIVDLYDVMSFERRNNYQMSVVDGFCKIRLFFFGN